MIRRRSSAVAAARRAGAPAPGSPDADPRLPDVEARMRAMSAATSPVRSRYPPMPTSRPRVVDVAERAAARRPRARRSGRSPISSAAAKAARALRARSPAGIPRCARTRAASRDESGRLAPVDRHPAPVDEQRPDHGHPEQRVLADEAEADPEHELGAESDHRVPVRRVRVEDRRRSASAPAAPARPSSRRGRAASRRAAAANPRTSGRSMTDAAEGDAEGGRDAGIRELSGAAAATRRAPSLANRALRRRGPRAAGRSRHGDPVH